MNTTNKTNAISQSLVEFINRSPATIAVETSILLLIGLIAFGGNLLVVISIYRNPSLRTITNYFVLSLAVTDILYPTTSLPLTLVWSVKSRFISTRETCEFQAILNKSLTIVSVSNLLFMSVNRFVCVCKPQKYKKVFSKTKTLIMISGNWIGAFVSSVLFLKGGWEMARAKFSSSLMACQYVYQPTNMTAKVLCNTILCLTLVISCAIIVFCNFKVFKKIREHKRNVAPASNPNSLGTSVQEIKITWIMFAVLIGYSLTWIPVILLSLIINFIPVRVPWQVRIIVIFSGSSSCALNPLIYGLMNPAFRQEYKKIFKLSR